jgi:hypothetical protein
LQIATEELTKLSHYLLQKMKEPETQEAFEMRTKEANVAAIETLRLAKRLWVAIDRRGLAPSRNINIQISSLLFNI